MPYFENICSQHLQSSGIICFFIWYENILGRTFNSFSETGVRRFNIDVFFNAILNNIKQQPTNLRCQQVNILRKQTTMWKYCRLLQISNNHQKNILGVVHVKCIYSCIYAAIQESRRLRKILGTYRVRNLTSMLKCHHRIRQHWYFFLYCILVHTLVVMFVSCTDAISCTCHTG